jgi:hypothetical protein
MATATATTKLSDLQLVLLATAAQRGDGSVLPPPDRLGEQATRIRRAISPLLKRTLIEEVPVTDAMQVWREEAGDKIGLVITAAGRAIVADEEREEPISKKVTTDVPAAARPATSATTSAATSKIATVVGLLRRPDGATLAELIEATGWLPHSTRAALTGLRKKGHTIAKGSRGDMTAYSIAAAA